MLDNKAKKLLKKAGWYEGRKIDITNYVRSLEDSGYEVFDAAREFLEEYGELEFVLNYEFEGEIRSDISMGMIAEDSDDFWNGELGESKCGFLSWVNYKAGKEFKLTGYKNKNYIVD